MLTGLDHIQLALPAGQENQARWFYGELLGLREIEKPLSLQAKGGCWFQGRSFQLHVGVMPDFVPATKAHPAFLVDDLAALHGRFTEFSVAVMVDTAVPGTHRFYASDPFGNRLEFIQAGEGFNERDT